MKEQNRVLATVVRTCWGSRRLTLELWKVQCSRIVTLNIALLGIILSLVTISRCDFFRTTLDLLLRPSTAPTDHENNNQEYNSSRIYLSVGLFRYGSSEFEDENYAGFQESSTCRLYDDSSAANNNHLFNHGRLRLAQAFSILAPISSTMGCIAMILDVCNLKRYWTWVMLEAWSMAFFLQFFSYVAFISGLDFCQGSIDGFGECQRSGGAVSAIFAMVLDVLAFVGTCVTAKQIIRLHVPEISGKYEKGRKKSLSMRIDHRREDGLHNRSMDHDDKTRDSMNTQQCDCHLISNDFTKTTLDVTMDITYESDVDEGHSMTIPDETNDVQPQPPSSTRQRFQQGIVFDDMTAHINDTQLECDSMNSPPILDMSSDPFSCSLSDVMSDDISERSSQC